MIGGDVGSTGEDMVGSLDSDRGGAIELMCVHQVFERTVEQHRDSIAAVCGSDRWTYDQLNRRANAIAHGLIAMGIEPEEPVGVAMPKSCEMIAVLLGILKAGGAYVPLVDNQPMDRVASIVEDAGCRWIFGVDGYLDELHGRVDRVICPDLFEDCSGENVGRACSASDLGYIMYTSGSTGVPKGVMIEHDGIVRLVHDQWFLKTGADRHYLFLSSLSFDASTIEIYSAILHGGKLVICPQRVPTPDEVYACVHDEGVNSAWIAFGFFRALFRARPEIFEGVDLLMTGGEPVLGGLIREAQVRLPGTTFVNNYGPTEATALATGYVIPRGFDDEHDSLPIGRALHRMRMYVLDEDQQPVEPGEPGELYIGGVGIARGYLKRDELNAKHFLDDPFDDSGSGRMYRTGDKVVERADGNIVFLGRIDDQVKIRGNRIELGEIESALMRVGWVESAGVVVFGLDERVAVGACVTIGSGVEFDLDELIGMLKRWLPEHGIPERVRVVEELPVNRNGKLDRDAVRGLFDGVDAVGGDAQVSRGGEPIVGETQKILAGMISELLGVEVLYASDHFLHLGGHSLRAIVLSARVRDCFGFSLPISQIYRLGTIGAMAQWIDGQVVGGRSDEPNPLRRVDRDGHDGRWLLSFNQQRLWMLNEIHPDDPSYNITIRLRHDGELDRSCFTAAWEALFDRHEVLWARIEVIDGVAYQVIDPDVSPVIHWHDCQGESDEAVRKRIKRESMRVFSLDSAPLVRCGVYEGEEGASIAITIHHILSDAWSCEVLQRELNGVYSALVDGREPGFDELEIQYTDFAHWQRSLPGTLAYQADLEYWVEQLEAPEYVELPMDYARGSEASSRGKRLSTRIGRSESAAIRSAADGLGVTVYAYTLALFQVWMHRVTGQDDLMIGTPMANREWSQVDGLIGFFVETAAFRTQLSCSDRVDEVIRRVSRGTLEAFDHLHVPFQHIVDAIHSHPSNGRNPLFEVFFNHIAMEIQSSDEDDLLGFVATEIDNETAKFDLTCYVLDEVDGIEVVFNYRSALFQEETMARYLDQYLRVLCDAHRHLDSALSQVPVLNPDELLGANTGDREGDGQTESGQSGMIHELVERSVERYPDHLAVIWDSGSLTYRQLWERSGRVAQMLASDESVDSGKVLVCSSDAGMLSSAILGVLRSGGMYIPIDPAWPDHRIEQIATSISRVDAIVDDAMAARLRAIGFGGRIFDTQLVVDGQDLGSRFYHEERCTPDSPAYMLFTSGSTGMPKGVVQSHGGVVSHMTAFARSVEMSDQDRILQVSSPAFDAAIMDMFSAWFTGASLCVCDLQHSGHDDLVEAVEANGITIYHSAPTVFRWVTDAIGDGGLPGVRVVVLGGEPVVRADVDRLGRCFPGCERFINGLGLTESSLTAQLRVHPDELDRYTRWIPVGYPVEGSTIRLVDREGRASELVGEIEIESNRVAIGYWNPERQAIDPIGDVVEGKGARRFRTGDQGMMLADGSIVHTGRIDHQVQVHGCRVEINEVLHAVKSFDGVVDGAVIAVSDEQGGHVLRCSVVCDPESQVSEGQLRDGLGGLLPGYMVPAEIRRVERIPRVGGGKIDRRALEEMRSIPFVSGSGTNTEPDNEPDSEVLALVRDGFARVLGEESVGAHERFFQLGGNSLKAIQLFAMLRKELGTRLPVSTIYRSSTPAQLAQAIESFDTKKKASETFVGLVGSAGDDPVYLFPGIGGEPMGFGPLVERLDGDRAYIGIQLPNVKRVESLGNDLKRVAAWIIEQMGIEPGRRAPDMIGYSFGGGLAYEIALQFQDRGYAPGRLIFLDSHLPFGLPAKKRAGKAGVHLKNLLGGTDGGRMNYIRSRVRNDRKKKSLKEQQTPAELLEYRALSKANRRMIVEYVPSSLYRGMVGLVRATQPSWLAFHEDDGCNGWSASVPRERIDIRTIDSQHLSLLDSGPVDELARYIDAWLIAER